ncbi:MAG: prepilin-type N-terminal cleavage/methylation domain-containing protein [bacterium]|nr:prepilin-type N-terminal cleavage/methylation domain-containing protein [bacterium]
MSVARRIGSRAGFTILELLLALGLLAIVAQKTFVMLTAASKATATDTSALVLEEKARRVLQQVAMTIMSADRDSLVPGVEAPLDTDALRFKVHLGVENGEVVWSEPEEIVQKGQKVVWRSYVATEKERHITWTNLVAPFLEGEIPNGMDDNGNGVIDEKGLSFEVDRSAVTIRLTLAQAAGEGDERLQTVETVVTCRNLQEAKE